jgi:hypothetical protein
MKKEKRTRAESIAGKGSSKQETEKANRAATLKAGQEITLHGRKMTFVRRLRSGFEIVGATRNVFRCPDYAGLNGPQDARLVEFSDQMFDMVSKEGGR